MPWSKRTRQSTLRRVTDNWVNPNAHNIYQREQIMEKPIWLHTLKKLKIQILPKIHQVDLSLRQWMTNWKIWQLADHFIGSLVPLSNSYLRDSTCMINILSTIHTLPSHLLLYTLDVSSLCTNIPHDEGIQAIKKMLAIHQVTSWCTPQVILLNYCRVNRQLFWFQWEMLSSNFWHSHGNKFGTSYASLFMARFEALYVYTYPLQPTISKRFIDDYYSHLTPWSTVL